LPDALADARREGREHHVAGGVAQRVVDGLEVVDVAEQDSQIRARGSRLFQRGFEPADHLGAVGKAGEGVEPGQPVEPMLGFDLVVDDSQCGPRGSAGLVPSAAPPT